MQVKIYRITCHVRIGNNWQKYTIEIPAIKSADAIEKAYSLIGSRHKVSRNLVRILDIKEVSLDEVKRKEVILLRTLDKLVVFR